MTMWPSSPQATWKNSHEFGHLVIQKFKLKLVHVEEAIHQFYPERPHVQFSSVTFGINREVCLLQGSKKGPPCLLSTKGAKTSSFIYFSTTAPLLFCYNNVALCVLTGLSSVQICLLFKIYGSLCSYPPHNNHHTQLLKDGQIFHF